MPTSSTDTTATLIASVIILAISMALAAAVSAYQCTEKWSESGLESKWRVGAGCRVKMPDGRWIPAERVREIELTPKAEK